MRLDVVDPDQKRTVWVLPPLSVEPIDGLIGYVAAVGFAIDQPEIPPFGEDLEIVVEVFPHA